MKLINSIAKEIPNNIKLLSVLLIFSGFIRINHYYYYAGINIADYIELGEILTLFLDEVYMLVKYLIIGLTLIYFFSELLESIFRLSRKKLPQNSKLGRFMRFLESIHYTGYLLAGLLSIVTLLCSIFFEIPHVQIVAFVWVIISFYFIFKFTNKKDEVRDLHGFKVLVILIAIVAPLVLAHKDFSSVRKKDFSNYTLVTNSKNIELKEGDTFYGKTKGFYFLKVDSVKRIIPAREVKELRIK